MTKLTGRQVADHVLLMNLMGASRAKRGNAFDRILATTEAQPGPEKTYEVKVSVNGVDRLCLPFPSCLQIHPPLPRCL